MPVDRILDRDRPRGGIEMRDDLVTRQVEIDPPVARSPLLAPQHAAVKGARFGEIMDGKGEVEGTQCHASIIHQRPACANRPSHRTKGSAIVRIPRPRHSAAVNRHPALACLLLGAAAACGFAPLGFWPLTLVCFAAWMVLVHDAPTMRSALVRGWLFGLGHFSINDNWIQHAFDFQDAMPPALGYAAPVLLALYLAVYPMLAAGVAWRLASARAAGDRATPPGWPFVLAFGAAWIATEWLRATMFTGYAWDPLGVIWLPAIEIARVARFVGTYALSGLTVVVAGSLILMAQRRWHGVAIVGVLIAALFLVGIGARAPSATATTRVRVVQPGIGLDRHGETDEAAMRRQLVRLSGRPGAVPRIVMWPEGVVRDYLEDGYPPFVYDRDPGVARAQLARVLGPDDLLLTGGVALVFDQNDVTTAARNAIFAVDARGRLGARYDKAHLVPYGEYLPMRPVLSAIGLSRLVPGDLDFKAGPGPQSVTLPGVGAIGMQICYEIIFRGRSSTRRIARACCSIRRTTPGSDAGARRSIWRRRGCARSRKDCRSCDRRRPAFPR